MKLIDEIVASGGELRALRHGLYAPCAPVCADRHKSGSVADRLARWGFSVQPGPGGSGIIGVLRRGNSKRSIGLAAVGASVRQDAGRFAGRNRPQDEPCTRGGDGHPAMLLGAARYLALHGRFDGRVVLILPSTMHGGADAKSMVRDGLFQCFPCDAVFGVRIWPDLPAGTFGFNPGPTMASCNAFEIRVAGDGAKAALPHLGSDPVMAAVQIVQSLQSIITRSKRPVDAAALTVTRIRAGQTDETVPQDAWIAGTVRTFDEAVTALIEQRMRSIAQLTARAHGAQAQVRFDRHYPTAENHPVETALAVRVAREVAGADRVVPHAEPTVGAEDFSFLLRERPGAYLWMGSGGHSAEAGCGATPGTPLSRHAGPGNDLLPLGASFWVRLTEAFLPHIAAD
jgi:hippurate hydrolase